MRAAKIRISTHLILQALGFPEGTEVRACYGERAGYPGEIDLIVTHPDLDEVAEGAEAPLMVPEITFVYPAEQLGDGDPYVRPQPSFTLFDWGQPQSP